MTKLFLAAGVAALAISASATAGPGGHAAYGAKAEQSKDSRVARATKATERQATRSAARTANLERRGNATRVASARPERATRAETRQVRVAAARPDKTTRVEGRQAARADRQQMRSERVSQVQDRIVNGQQLRTNRGAVIAINDGVNGRWAKAKGRGLVEGCPPGLFAKANGCLPPGQAKKLIGTPLATAATFGALSVLPSSASYLYPDTPEYYYRYGNGYAYRVERNSNLISTLLPLLAGGYMPGQYLPTNYMSSYVPNYYGLNTMYRDSSYACNRYVNGSVYQVDCVTGMIENVVPLYAGGYGVGQMLPSAYYNVPSDYRSLYYDTANTGYYYAPGAIYQYDPQSSMITSVAALLSPGFGVGQQLPMGYSAYNVPYAYRDNYYDTSDAWYRYNNGNIYRVDPATQLVTAIVASILT